ncbi:hypothetical protein GRI89_16600 [Altererythrobacter salegens]|uniref:Uncharacterized protein n=1 Tax=Croceibacterium salegens TaxID=1737568 RepID=A0A6I4SYN1_9SPHN|nr:hypothetical protein [Croceibacterium salegens]MXO61165.1 hypothetical protein [Croceibacterium salegens]
MKLALLLGAMATTFAAPALADDEPKPLFAQDAPLTITIDGPIRKISRSAARSTDPYPATLTIDGETIPITLAARGLSRRQPTSCSFPPLRVQLTGKPTETSPFAGQKTLKLVTHCRERGDFERYALREYAAYRLYNRLTSESLRVRLLRVRYLDAGKDVSEHWGFFIEDIDDAAERMGGKELEVPGVSYAALDSADASRVAMFRYMISDLDFDTAQGPEGTDCCHNSKLVGETKESRSALIPVPYDFDFSGFVNAPYALPPESIGVRSVRERHYRGLCRDNETARQAAREFIAARPALEAEIRGITQIEADDRDHLIGFIADFFDDVATPDLVEKKLLKDCR